MAALVPQEADVDGGEQLVPPGFQPTLLHSSTSAGGEKNSEKPPQKGKFFKYEGDVTALDDDGFTPLMKASKDGDEGKVISLLAVPDINVNYQVQKDFGHKGFTALMWGAEKGHGGIVKHLCEHKGIAVNLQNDYDHTALIYAAMEGRTDVVKHLCNHKDIEVNLQDEDNKTAAHWARNKGHQAIADMIRDHTPK